MNEAFNIQYLVTADAEKAALFSKKLAEQHQVPSFYAQQDNLYYLRLGPLNNVLQAENILEQVKENYPQAYILPNAP